MILCFHELNCEGGMLKCCDWLFMYFVRAVVKFFIV